MKKMLVVFVAVVAILSIATSSFAQDPAKKLGRGIANILTGWVEIPKNIYNTSIEANPLVGLTVGTAKGIGMSIVRTGAGVYELITFPFPLPEDYMPILEPEFVFQTE